MKRIFALIIGLFVAFTFMGCNTDGSDINIDLDEFIANPVNLTISGTTLSWDEVEDANGYIVYANDEEVDKVSNTTYDFSKLSEDVLVFRVRTRAPRGMQDSSLSVSLAYVANKTAEVNNVRTVMQENQIQMTYEFSEELVNKGLLSEDLDGLLKEFKDFTEAMDTVDSFGDFMTALQGLLGEANNIEAIVSAFVKTELVDYLETEVEDLEDTLAYPPYWLDTDNIQRQIDAYNDLIDEIESSPDQIVLAITSTIDYLISIEVLISNDLITLVDKIAATEDISTLNVNELVDVKEELVSVLRESIPSEEDMVLVMQVFDLVSQMAGTSFDYSNIDNYKGKIAAQTLYSIEAFINFLDSFEKADFEAFIAELNSEDEEEMQQAEIAIQFVKVFNKFYDNNQNLFDTIENVFTEAEREQLLNEYMDAVMDTQNTPVDLTGVLNFQQLINLQVIFEDSFSDILDAFVESDGEIIRQYVISNCFRTSYYPETKYTNSALGIEYTNYTEYRVEREFNEIRLQRETVYLFNAYMQSISESEFNKIRAFLVESLFDGMKDALSSSEFPTNSFPFTIAEVEALEVVITNGFDDINSDLYSVLKALFKYLVDEDIFDEMLDVQKDIHNHFKQEYGYDYKTTGGSYFTDDYESYSNTVFYAKVYDGFMTSRNRGYIDSILDFIFVFLGEDVII